jgi:hypothetical protein
VAEARIDRPTREDVGRLRGNLRRTALITVGTFVAGIALAASSDQVYAAFGGVIAAVSMAAFSGCVYAHQAAPTYARDRNAVTGRLDAIWPYVYKAAVWGVAAAGLGALLAEAIPSPLQNVAPSRLSTTSLLAVTFAGIGIAAGILETWRDAVGGHKD